VPRHPDGYRARAPGLSCPSSAKTSLNPGESSTRENSHNRHMTGTVRPARAVLDGYRHRIAGPGTMPRDPMGAGTPSSRGRPSVPMPIDVGNWAEPDGLDPLVVSELRSRYRCTMCHKQCQVPCSFTLSEFQQMARIVCGLAEETKD
jgi:hypothetical protein